MSNGLKNAGGLDGALNWNLAGSGAITVDETVLGAPGRGVIVLTGTGALSLFSDAIPIGGNQVAEAFAFWSSSDPTAGLEVQWLNGGTPISVTPLGFIPASRGPANRGLPSSFNYSYARVTAPAGATMMQIKLAGQQAAGASKLLLLKPFLAVAPSYSRPTVWDPGTHTNPDLQLPVWPSIVPPFQADQLPTPLSNMASYSTDTNIATTRDLYTQLQYSFKGKVRLDAAGVDALEQFYLDNRSGFFVVRPDTQQLCIGFWNDDGAPAPVESRGAWTFYQIGLRMAVT